MYTNAKAEDKATQEKAELAILSEFLPPEVSEDEINKLIDEAVNEIGAKEMKDMGRVISLVKEKNSGVDGSKVAELVKARLSS